MFSYRSKARYTVPKNRVTILCILLCLIPFAGLSWGKGIEDQVKQPVRQAISLLKKTQEHEKQWRIDKEKLIARLDQLQTANEDLSRRRTELQCSAAATESRIVDKKKQLADIARITNEISPFLHELYEQLQHIVADGLPFLETEREQRIEKLRPVMMDPSVTVSEKYHKVMEALLVEAEYGFTYEVTQQTIPLENAPTLVNIFRLGRLGLFYLSLDKKLCGLYNIATKTWQPLGVKHLPAIRAAVAIGLKRRPVELLDLPVGKMVNK